MPVRRRFRRRRPFRRRFFRRRRFGRMKRYPQKVYSYKRVTGFTNTQNGAAGAGGIITAWTPNPGNIQLTLAAAPGSTVYLALALAHQVNDLPGYTEFLTLYDRYKIVGVLVKMTNNNTGGSGAAPSGVQYPNPSCLVHTVVDYDDANSPAGTSGGVQVLQQYQNYKLWNLQDTRQSTFKRFYRPRAAAAIYSGAFTSYANIKAPWIDSNSPSVQHYGLKMIFECINNSTTASEIFIHCELTYYLRFRDTI